MKLLLDTCTFLWIISDDPALSDSARGAYTDPANEIYLSAVSVWEIMIKHTLGRLPLPEPPYRFIPNQRERHLVEGLPLDEESVLQLDKLPRLHKDPFDRMLVCQAIAHGLVVVTPDEAIRQYPLRTLW